MQPMAWPEKLINTARDRDIANKIRVAIEQLFAQDAALFEVDANERSISHRLAVHLTRSFPEWDVDCEYNRKGHAPKKLLRGRRVDAADTDGGRVFPDIIVHRRNKPENLLVIEIKKSTSAVGDEVDREKLRAFCAELGYEHALFLRFVSATDAPSVATVEWCPPPNDA